ncbi:uncharacterized protein TNCV_2005091 [Trichonephila clavipes]|nr:uncharacterized protein TNCV_2005091 [Trichonephila clavipes]
MRLSQADAAGRSQCVSLVLLATLGSIPIRRFCVQRPIPGPTTSYNTAREDRFLQALSARRRRTLCAAARCRPLSSIRKKNLATVRNRLHNAGSAVCKKTSCVRSPSTDDEGTAYAGQENMFLGRSNNGLLCCSQTSPDLQWK